MRWNSSEHWCQHSFSDSWLRQWGPLCQSLSRGQGELKWKTGLCQLQAASHWWPEVPHQSLHWGQVINLTVQLLRQEISWPPKAMESYCDFVTILYLLNFKLQTHTLLITEKVITLLWHITQCSLLANLPVSTTTPITIPKTFKMSIFGYAMFMVMVKFRQLKVLSVKKQSLSWLIEAHVDCWYKIQDVNYALCHSLC